MDARRVVWTAIVGLFVAMAIAGPVVIATESAGGGQADASGGNTVVMARLAYAPASLAVRPGTEVLFDNRDVAPHTVTADDGSVDSGVLNPGTSFRLVVGRALDYHCEIHPSMTARIVLEG